MRKLTSSLVRAIAVAADGRAAAATAAERALARGGAEEEGEVLGLRD